MFKRNIYWKPNKKFCINIKEILLIINLFIIIMENDNYLDENTNYSEDFQTLLNIHDIEL